MDGMNTGNTFPKMCQQEFFLGKLRKFYLKGGVMKEIFHASKMMMTSSLPTRQESGSVYPSSLSQCCTLENCKKSIVDFNSNL